MAATHINSTEYDIIDGTTIGSKLTASAKGGKLRVAFWTCTPGALEAASTIKATRLPPQAKIVFGVVETGAHTGADITIGLQAVDGSGYLDEAGTVADDPDLLDVGMDIALAGTFRFAETAADAHGYVTEKEVILLITTATATLQAAEVLNGYIVYSTE